MLLGRAGLGVLVLFLFWGNRRFLRLSAFGPSVSNSRLMACFNVWRGESHMLTIRRVLAEQNRMKWMGSGGWPTLQKLWTFYEGHRMAVVNREHKCALTAQCTWNRPGPKAPGLLVLKVPNHCCRPVAYSAAASLGAPPRPFFCFAVAPGCYIGSHCGTLLRSELIACQSSCWVIAYEPMLIG